MLIALLLVVRYLSRNSSTKISAEPYHISSYVVEQSRSSEQVTYKISTDSHTVTAEPAQEVTKRQEKEAVQDNRMHKSTGEFHKLATTESSVSAINEVESKPWPGKQKRVAVIKEVEESSSLVQERGAVNITVFYEESPDVIEALPKQFLPDYKSFCWYSTQAQLFCLPSVYIAGIPKCGTTDMFDKLTWHPQIATPGYGKEHTYWNRRRLGRPSGFIKHDAEEKQSFQDFLKAFDVDKLEDVHNSMFLDGTPSLLWDLVGWETRYPQYSEPPYTNADLLHSVTPDAKIIVMLRDPVKRLVSDYVYFEAGRSREEKMMQTPLSFHDDVYFEMDRFGKCLKEDSLLNCCHSSENSVTLRLHLGVYVCYISEWKRLFRDKLLVLTLEEYSKDPMVTLTRVFKFLDVDKPDTGELEKFIIQSKTRNSNDKGQGNFGKPMDATVKLLRDFYEPYNNNLALLLNDSKFYFDWESV